MRLTEFWQIVNNTEFPPDWRYGQVVFNFLAEVRPDLSEQVRGNHAAGLDTFYVNDRADPRMATFTQWLSENW